jgi:hypothetical protein
MTDDKTLRVPERLRLALADRYRLDRDVAIKVLHPELTAILGAERFLQPSGPSVCPRITPDLWLVTDFDPDSSDAQGRTAVS